jgi:hypothetical protein
MGGFETGLIAFYVVTLAAFIFAAYTAPIIDEGTVD